MKRKDFLRTIGATGIGLSLPFQKSINKLGNTLSPPNVCELIPSETAGPFPLDLTENTAFFRTDIRETEEGVQLNLKLKIVGIENCEPMQNVRVNIWHCSKDGLYSGYNGNNNPGQQGLTYLRGYQITDANGEVNFTTIFPGWYNGRICHVHFQVFVSSMYSAVSQLTFPLSTKNELYSENTDFYKKGADPKTFASDMVFADGHEYQLATLEKDANTNAYNSYMEIGVKGAGVTGVGYIENQNAEVFELGQNYPNPYRSTTTIPVELFHSAKVQLELWDLQGQKLKTIISKNMSAGKHEFPINIQDLGLTTNNYVYQLIVESKDGIFKEAKMMTALR